MPRFAANLSFLFTEMLISDRFSAAKESGFEGVEILYPYDISADILRKLADRAGLEIVLINTPPPNWAGGDRGFAAIPELQELFRRDFDRALRFSHILHARQICILAGTAAGAEARSCFVENLIWATRRAPHASLLIEPLNQQDKPGYFLSDFEMAAEILAEVAAPNLGLLFDSYHAQMITGDMFATWQRHAGQIRHIQISGYPDRQEPDRGEIDHTTFFRALDESGYRGWIGAEYTPRHLTENGLGWLTNARSTPSGDRQSLIFTRDDTKIADKEQRKT